MSEVGTSGTVTGSPRTVADPTRLAVLDSLAADGARCHQDLEVDLGGPASRLSFHLKVLRDAGLVRANRQGRRVRYCLVFGAIDAVHAAVPELTSVANLDPTCSACEQQDARGRR